MASPVNFGAKTSDLIAALNSGLAGGIDPKFIAQFGRNAPVVISILFDAITSGTRWAALTAAIFVSFGAVSSLLIPNPKSTRKAKGSVAPATSAKGPRVMSAIIVAQFIIMIGLIAAISNEYQANYWMQQWIGQNASPLGFFLSGYLGTLLATIIGIILIIWKLILPIRRLKPVPKSPV